MTRVWTSGSVLLALGAFLAVAYTGLVYLVYPGYIDHGEPSVLLLGWRLLDGHQVYPDFEAAERTVNVYGPYSYLVHLPALLAFGDSVLVGKLTSIVTALLFCLSPILLFRGRALWVRALGVTFLSALVLVHTPAPIWNRPDIFMATCVLLAVAFARWGEGRDPLFHDQAWWATVGIGICAGLAMGFKIHAAVFVAPVALFHVWGRDFRHWIALPAVMVGVGLLPFAFDVFSLSGLTAWFGLLASKPFDPGMGMDYLRYNAVSLVLVGAASVLYLFGNGAEKDGWALPLYLLAILGVMALVVIPAAKPGAGWYYLLPFSALVLDVTERLVWRKRPAIWALGLSVIGIIGLLVTAVPIQKRFHLSLDVPLSERVAAELASIMADHIGATIEMGLGEDALQGYHNSWQRSRLVLAGHPYSLDAAIMTEVSQFGVTMPPAALAKLAACDPDIWLIPSGEEPFSLIGYYGNPVFTDTWRTAFRTAYQRLESRTFFDVWRCKPQ
ncbi:MAG: hypothetical protein ACPGOV_11205 [Magnetovibrionaceae bacterium]